MAINFLGNSLFIVLVVSILGVLIGLISKNKAVTRISFIILAVVLIVYALAFLVFH